MFITGPLLITTPLLLKWQPCINNFIIIIITMSKKQNWSEYPFLDTRAKQNLILYHSNYNLIINFT